MDKKLLGSQMKRLERGWEHLAHLAQKKYSQHTAECDEFASLRSKIRDTEISLQQQQQQLLLGLKSPEDQDGSQSIVTLAAELQAARRGFTAVRSRAEVQMKRLWGEKEKKILEDAIQNLKKQFEALEPLNLEVESQIKKCDLKSKMKETLLWIRNLLSELTLPISLLPDNILFQIRKCKVMHDSILDKQQAMESLAEEVLAEVPNLTTPERDNVNSILQDLQNQYQMLVLQSTQRSQQLEFKLEERSKLFEMMKEAQLTLEGHEALLVPKTEAPPTEAELEHHHATLRASQKGLQEVESLISARLRELTDASEDLSVFERLFLDNHLNNLKTRVSRIQRCIQSKCNEVEHKISSYREFHERESMLQKEVDMVQHNKLLLHLETNQDAKEEFQHFKERLAGVRRSILDVLKLREVFDHIGLNWDGSQLDQLQTQAKKKKKRR